MSVRVAAVLAAFALCACAQRFSTPLPLPAADSERAVALMTPANTVPTFRSSFTVNATPFPYLMVGANPATHTSTTIQTAIVPLALKLPNGTVLDATAIASSIAGSPLFRAAAFQSGTTQYGDAIMRAQFWQFARGTNYHVFLAAPHVFATQPVTVPAADTVIATQSDGTKVRALNFFWFVHNSSSQPAAIFPLELAKLHIPATTFTIFVTRDVKVLEQSGFCCYGGYHDEFVNPPNAVAGTYTAAWGAIFSANIRDMTHLGHEVAEWMNDPFYLANATRVPRWVHPLSHVCASNLLEVGDPVASIVFTESGTPYSFEDAAFLQWFARQSASATVNGRYDLLGRLTAPAATC